MRTLRRADHGPSTSLIPLAAWVLPRQTLWPVFKPAAIVAALTTSIPEHEADAGFPPDWAQQLSVSCSS